MMMNASTLRIIIITMIITELCIATGVSTAMTTDTMDASGGTIDRELLCRIPSGEMPASLTARYLQEQVLGGARN